MSSGLIQEVDLHALVDGELDPERRRQVEDHLLQHPEHAALVERWRRQNAALRTAFEPVALEAAPASLREAAMRAPPVPMGQGPIETGAVHWGRPGAAPRVRPFEARGAGRRRALAALVVMLSAVAAIAAGVVLFLSSRAAGPTISVASQGYAFRAGLTYATYAGGARPVEFDAGARSELIAALRASVGFARLPEVADADFRLIGGRVLPGVAAPAGFLVYERADGRRLGLYFERADGAAIGEGAQPNLTAIEWRANGFAFVLVGQLSVELMQAAAERAAASIAAPGK